MIAAGHTYQVNHTIRLRAVIAGEERGFYRDLCLAQRGGFAAFLDLGRHRVLSASPELFFRLEGDRVTTRPMKGTAPRGRWPAEDEEAAARLVASAKDRAENAMIVDLLRNDLGRVCRPGSVGVEHMLEPERYETVWQLTSTVAGELRPGTSVLDVFRALFPSGSVTGAPKIRTMRIVADLEDAARGVYCGAIGYLAPPGSGEPRANFNVAIRTVVLDGQTRTAEFGVGGGITFDSSRLGRVRGGPGQGTRAHDRPSRVRAVRDDPPRRRTRASATSPSTSSGSPARRATSASASIARRRSPP